MQSESLVETLILHHLSAATQFLAKKMKLSIQFLVINFMLQGLNATFCEQGLCSCDNTVVVCIDLTTPRFKYRPEITTLYLERVQLQGVVDLLRNLPNLKYLTMVNMLYFNCAWMVDIPQDIILTFDDCASTEDPPSSTKGEIINLIIKLKKKEIYMRKIYK